MNTNLNEVMAKIEKIRTLASRGGTAHEAEVAAAKMAELLLRHNLSMADIDAYADQTNRAVADQYVNTTSASWRIYLLSVIARAHNGANVSMVGTGRCRVFAHSHNLVVILSTYEWLVKLIERSADDAWKEYVNSGRWSRSARTWKNDYRNGFVTGIGRGYTAMRDAVKATSDNWGLVVVQEEEVRDAIRDALGTTQKRRNYLRGSAAHDRGFRDGSNVNLSGQVGSGRSVRTLG